MSIDRSPLGQWATVDAFHALFWGHTPSWLGVPVLKNPMDLFIYQEIMTNTRPQVIIESGTAWGGSTLFFASICDLVGGGEVLSIDCVPESALRHMYELTFGSCEGPDPTRPRHPRVTYLLGDVLSAEVYATVAERASGQRTMLILDSTHTTSHVLSECERYASLVTPGCYLSIEDIKVEVQPPDQKNPGSRDAAWQFLERHPEFQWDHRWIERYLMTQNAYLQRV